MLIKLIFPPLNNINLFCTGTYPNYINIDYALNVNINQSRRRWWGGSSPTYDGFNWGIGWGMNMGAGPNSYITPHGILSSTLVEGGQTWTVNGQSGLNISIELWSAQFSGYYDSVIMRGYIDDIYNNPRLFCIERTGLVCTSNDATTDPSGYPNYNNQYCQR